MERNIKKNQGEIFGIALMFVVLVIGIIIYGQIKALNPDNSADIKTEGKYKILAEGSLNSILKMDVGCQVERDDRSLRGLLSYCIENAYVSDIDPKIICDGNIVHNSCSYSIEILNDTLLNLLNTSILGPIPYKLLVSLPHDSSSSLNVNLTNFGTFKYGNNILVENNPSSNQITYRKAGYKRAPSGLRSWATSRRNINFELYLYYR